MDEYKRVYDDATEEEGGVWGGLKSHATIINHHDHYGKKELI